MDTADPRAALDALVTRHNDSYAALSRMLGRNDAYLQQFVRRGSPRVLAERDRRRLAAYFRVDEALLGAPDAPLRESASMPSGVRIQRMDAVASAGPGGLVDDDRSDGGVVIDPAIMQALGVRPEDASVITAQGESMVPTILPGDALLVDRRQTRIGTRSAIFVLRADGLLMVKRVARHAQALIITSDNPDFRAVEADQVEIIGKVVWLSRAIV
jgi:phage repressor protein C with HTH and peptisase S24 domain